MNLFAPILLLAVGGSTPTQPAAAPAKPTPVPCPATAGLEIGMPRAAAFDMMRRKNPDLKTTNARSVHHAPAGRPYQVDVTFDSESPDAKIAKLRWVFTPGKIADEMTRRYGPPADHPSADSMLWRIDRCGIIAVTRPLRNEQKAVVGDELTEEALPTKSK